MFREGVLILNLREKHKQARRRENRIILIVIVCILALIIGGITLIFGDKGKNKDTELEKTDKNTEITNDQEEIDSFEIETEHCTLYYPLTWAEQIEVEFSEEAGYKVEFWGNVDGKEAKHLFNICFNSDDGDLLGYFEREDEVVNVSVERIDLDFDSDWTEEEQNQIYAMQEEMNYVIDMLNKDENYVNP